uniref:Uncharacterized protein n=1 Tax=Triticum urartu TaxID=4572 RepID=A0A8R7UVW1_TRIUA
MSLVGNIKSLVVGVFIVHDRAEWTLITDFHQISDNDQGVLNTGLAFLLISRVIRRSGPIYPPMFNSLSLVMTTVLESVLLDADIYLGR